MPIYIKAKPKIAATRISVKIGAYFSMRFYFIDELQKEEEKKYLICF
jgi:hypothetical protein